MYLDDISKCEKIEKPFRGIGKTKDNRITNELATKCSWKIEDLRIPSMGEKKKIYVRFRQREREKENCVYIGRNPTSVMNPCKGRY